MTLDLKDRLYTSSEVAEILGVSLRSVYRYLEEGKLDADIKTATGRHRFSKKNILDFLQPGGITREDAEATFKNESEEDDFDVLDLPAINKSRKPETKEDDFSFDLDDDFFKSLNFDSEPNSLNKNEPMNYSSNSAGMKNGEFVDDDLEKLLKEFEEKEGLLNLDETKLEEDFDFDKSKNPVNNFSATSNSINEKTYDFDADDFDLDEFFKELESDPKVQNNVSNTTNSTYTNNNANEKKNDDFDFDLDFLDDLFEEEEKNKTSRQDNTSNYGINSQTNYSNSTPAPKVEIEEEDDSEDNWLERFRKAAQKNPVQSEPARTQESNNLNSNFFDKSNLDHFFNDSSSKDAVSSLGFAKAPEPIKEEKIQPKVREYYFVSSLNGLKEIAQNIDKIARKFDTDYAFTLNAGLSLHKPIAPFTLIHSYVRARDLELFEDYLNLTEVDNPSEASVCLMIPDDSSLFEDAYELHGLYVVSNVQLRSDLIDKGMDKLAREI